MLEVLISTALVSLLSLLLIKGGVYLQREAKLASQTLQALGHIENRLEQHRAEVLLGFAIDPQWTTIETTEFHVTTSQSNTVSSMGILGTEIIVSVSWLDPWGRDQALSISTWVAFK
ncbi:hypothetical protein A9264_10030 [Vibrio sp. UCD-FRSSP16_10]|nr:hypothetical protein A9260_10255 [Vibrio sp. UCD-FRSSP16_30]OBT21910.1 hypothetical protein A9264_10030 [Vibrio sp. UCD-FRSSP16_10]